MAKTRTDLIHRALKNLGALPQGQTPNSQDYNSVNALVDSTIEELAARDIIYIPDVDAIDEKVFMALGHILAWNAAAEFGAAADTALAALAVNAEKKLQEIDSQRPTYGRLEIEWF